ncbi:MAG: TolB family protein [Prolixibacteraceae bacterium]
MKTNITSITIALILALTINLNAQIPGSKIGVFTNLTQIGNTETNGLATYSDLYQSYQIEGSGINIWSVQDNFPFLWKKMNGDFIIQTRVKFTGNGTEAHKKTGVMLRSSEKSDASMIACVAHGDGLISIQYRKNDGDSVVSVNFDLEYADVLQIEKQGSKFMLSSANFGSTYVKDTIEGIFLGEDIMAGLFVCAHTDKHTTKVEFTNTRIFNTAESAKHFSALLEIMDFETGLRQVVHSGDHFEAPNWTPDGKTLIYNSKGLINKFDISTRKTSILNTDFANNNNNDHVLTFDGKQIGISHFANNDYTKSTIYSVPIEGGMPKKITDKTPSYFHGWSPDNKYLVYCAERNGQYDVYRIPAEGGNEEQLTNTKGLDDGPEYSPDGKYIYFNSTRTGTMQIWRMDADGGNQTQLTFDDLNDWFAHVSPDNKWLVFISFQKEMAANQHPSNQRVYIRAMPIDGGEIKVLGYVYGGQGTLNVPSWSPDSKRFAFVSYGGFE